MFRHLYDLIPLAAALPPAKVAVVKAEDDHVMEALVKTSQLGLIEPILIGQHDLIEALIAKHGLSMPYSIIDEKDPELATQKAIDLVHQNSVQLIMKGLVDSKVLMKGIVNSTTGIKTRALLSHISLLEIPSLDRLIFGTDMAMSILPTAEQKIAIIENLHEFAGLLHWDPLKIGLVSAVEKVNPKLLSSTDAEFVVEHFHQHPLKNAIVDGPFAIDNLVSSESCRIKGITSPVGGVANAMIFPSLDAGNVFYKTVTYLSSSESASVIVGAKVPIVLTSRADSSTSKMLSLLLAMVVSHEQTNSRY